MKSRWIGFLLLAFFLPLQLPAQKDTTRKALLDSFLLRQHGVLGNLAQSLLADTAEEDDPKELQPNDQRFRKYKGRVIRRINVEVLEFGTSISDTSKGIKNTLTRLGDFFHHNTRHYVVRKHLFFQKGDRLNPFLMADNERHLRDLDFTQDARISVKPVKGRRDSVDVTVLVKDVLSVGGRFHMHNTGSATVQAKEDNLAGLGDRLTLSTYFDKVRSRKFGWGAEYGARNIGGTFIDGYAGVSNFRDAFNSGREEEATAYLQLVKPLVNPYMKWTYALDASVHRTYNMYGYDSLYKSDFHYQYYAVDAWAGWNVSAGVPGKKNEDDRLRRLIAFRFIQQHFQEAPAKYDSQYAYLYSDLTGLLGSLSVFKQNFYKTQYIYGFGRHEDVPVGIDVALTAGWTQRSGRKRLYADAKFQRYYFTPKENYVNFTGRLGSYLYRKRPEDISLLANVDYLTRLRQMSPGWKQRSFFSVGLSRQFNADLEEPLFLESIFGLPEYRTDRNIYGPARVSLKAESVFYSPWTPFLFRIAPFVFGNMALIRPSETVRSHRNFFSSVGAGVRTRNESLIFGTIELKGYYFPGKNYYGQHWYVAVNTNVKFKYNRQLIKKPELIVVN